MRPPVFFSLDLEGAGDPIGHYSMLSVGLVPVHDPGQIYYRELKPINRRNNPANLRVGCSQLDCLVPFLHVPHYNPESSRFQSDRIFELLETHGAEPKEALEELVDWTEKFCSRKRRPVIVTDVPDYDFPGLKNYLAMFNLKNPFGFSAIPLKQLYQGRVGSISANPKKKFPSSKRRLHHAGFDAQRQAYLAQNVLGMFE